MVEKSATGCWLKQFVASRSRFRSQRGLELSSTLKPSSLRREIIAESGSCHVLIKKNTSTEKSERISKKSSILLFREKMFSKAKLQARLLVRGWRSDRATTVHRVWLRLSRENVEGELGLWITWTSQRARVSLDVSEGEGTKVVVSVCLGFVCECWEIIMRCESSKFSKL